MASFVLRTDGGARGNPGPAAAAFVLTDHDGSVVAEDARYLGHATNNVAEYEGLLLGLAAAQEAGVTHLEVLLDSELIVRQVNGEYRVKDAKLKPLHARVMEALEAFERASVAHVTRAENAAPDALLNAALDVATGDAEERNDTAGSEVSGMWELTVKHHFDAAHVLVGYPGECSELHGHTWDVEVTVAGRQLDDVGIVYDFKRLKDDLAAVLDPFDHSYLNEVTPFDRLNPTAENLAQHLCARLQERLSGDVAVVEVAVWESPVARILFRPGVS